MNALLLIFVLAFTMNAFCNYPDAAPAPAPAPVATPAPAPVATPPPRVTLPNSTTDQIGRTLTPQVTDTERAERIAEVLTTTMRNWGAGGVLESVLMEDPELGGKVQRWISAKERMERVRRERDRRTEAKRTAERMREAARQMRANARNASNPGAKAALESTATALDQGANGMDASATATPEQRQEGRDAEKELKQAEKDVPAHIQTAVDNALNEQKHPQQREAQERAEIGPDGQIIESPPGR